MLPQTECRLLPRPVLALEIFYFCPIGPAVKYATCRSVCSFIRGFERFQQTPDIIRYIVRISDNIKDSTREFHDSKRMLESLVCRAGIGKIGGCQLVDVPESLKRAGIENSTFVAVQTDENMDRISNLMNVLHWVSSYAKPLSEVLFSAQGTALGSFFKK